MLFFQAFFYASPEYREWVLSMLIDEVKFTEGFAPADLRVCDLGGGTGNFTQVCVRVAATDLCFDAPGVNRTTIHNPTLTGPR